MKSALRYIAVVVTIAVLALAGSLLVPPYSVSTFDVVRGDWCASDAWLLDRNGEPLSRVRIDHDRRRGEWVALADVSPALIAAVLESEDKRFYRHAGVDWRAGFAGLKASVMGGRRGASTLTMQLAAYLNPALEKSGRRSLIDKWRQARQALAMERSWTKTEILEAWLNLTPFRGELEGVDAAARGLLGTRPAGVDRVQGALLAALVRAPNARGPAVARRACRLLGNDGTACLVAQGIAADGLRPRRVDSDLDGAAPHLARKLLKRAGENVTSTLDARLQRFANETLVRHIRELEGRNVEDGALVVLDNTTDDVLAWVGSSGRLSSAEQVDGVTSRRLAGSTLKPFLYALAIERTLLTAASILDDTPLAVTLPTGLYVPQNYDRDFKGRISLRQALASSLNVPAVRTLTLVGYDSFYQQLKALGFELDRDADHYGYSLALGGAEVTLLQLTNAYRALANGGKTTPTLTLTLKGRERSLLLHQGEGRDGGGSSHVTIDPGAAFIITDILSDPAARALTFGFASPLATRYRAAVKTGTSKDMRDNWAVGYTTRYTVGVWVGNFSGAAMHDVSGVHGAAPIWREIMDFLHEGLTPREAPIPDGVTRSRVRYAGSIEPERDEWFIAGTESAVITPVASGAVKPRIESPPNGAIYATDPDIPRTRQRIVVQVRGAPRGAQLLFENGRRARADRPFLWLPEPGLRTVVLQAHDGDELDRVRIEVRGIKIRGTDH